MFFGLQFSKNCSKFSQTTHLVRIEYQMQLNFTEPWKKLIENRYRNDRIRLVFPISRKKLQMEYQALSRKIKKTTPHRHKYEIIVRF